MRSSGRGWGSARTSADLLRSPIRSLTLGGMTSTLIPERLAALNTIHLDEGGHITYDLDPWTPGFRQLCIAEAVAWLAGEPVVTDTPGCMSPILGVFARDLNDDWDDKTRQRLLPYAPRLAGTVDGQDKARSFLAMDWLVRVCAPAWLDLAGREADAQTFRDAPPIRSLADLRVGDPANDWTEWRIGRRCAEVLYARNEALTRASARAGAVAALMGPQGTLAAGGDAAWAVAGYVVDALATDVAHACTAAAILACVEAWDNASYEDDVDLDRVVEDTLAPVVARLQDSALELLDRMIDPSAAGLGYRA